MKTFTAYSLKLVLKANVQGVKIAGVTTDKFNGLNQIAKEIK